MEQAQHAINEQPVYKVLNGKHPHKQIAFLMIKETGKNTLFAFSLHGEKRKDHRILK